MLSVVHYIQNNSTPLMEEVQCGEVIMLMENYFRKYKIFVPLDLLSVMSCPRSNRQSGDRRR